MKKLEEAQYCILTAAKVIAPYIEDSFSAGKGKGRNLKSEAL